MNLNQLLAIPRYGLPDKVALSFRANNSSRQITYRELHDAVDRFAAGLVSWGLRPGDRVAIYMGNRPEFVIAYLAVLRAGAIATPINLRYRRVEIDHILADSTPRLMITESTQLPILVDAGIQQSSIRETIVAEDFARWMHANESVHLPTAQSQDIASIIYTSGTTGKSKGAMLSHSNIQATMMALQAAWSWERDDRLLLCLPLYHVHGLFVGLMTGLAAGATILLRPGYDANETIEDLLSGEPTLFFAVPTIYVRIVNELRKRSHFDLTHMRLFCSGSAPLSPDTFEAFRELTGHTILERYGMTETGMNLSNPYAGERIAGTVGTPLPGVYMRIVDGDGCDVTVGDEGDLLVRGSNVFNGYWNAPEKTAQIFVSDSAGQVWFHTGDLARQDTNTGYVTLLGRRNELIISGGFNIYPREIEELLETYPGVVEAAVVGRAHPEWGETPVAHIVCNGDVDDAELDEFCRRHLASFKAPAAYYRVPQLPRNAMGKLQKHLLPR